MWKLKACINNLEQRANLLIFHKLSSFLHLHVCLCWDNSRNDLLHAEPEVCQQEVIMGISVSALRRFVIRPSSHVLSYVSLPWNDIRLSANSQIKPKLLNPSNKPLNVLFNLIWCTLIACIFSFTSGLLKRSETKGWVDYFNLNYNPPKNK